jgi:hypothetical protein
MLELLVERDAGGSVELQEYNWLSCAGHYWIL